MTKKQLEHERLLVKSFFIKVKQERYLILLNTRRDKFRSYLSHFKDLDYRHTENIGHNQQKPETIYNKLLEYGASNVCFIISENYELDGKQSDLMDALHNIVGYRVSAFISCIPGKLAYYEGNDIGERFICRRV